MKSFFEFFAKRHILANVFTLMIVVLGLNALNQIERDVWPEVDYGIVIITTRYPGASPEDVELNVTNEIESSLKGISGIDRMVSVSMENISVIHLILDPDASDQDDIKRDIEEAVGRVTNLPSEITETPLVTEIETSVFPVIEVGLSGDIPYKELRELARRFEEKLDALPGVSSIKKYGYLAREIKVEVSPAAIRSYQVPLREIISAIQARNIRATGGSFESYTSDKDLVTLAQFTNPLEVGNVIVRSTFEGPLVRVNDLAVVRDDFEDERIKSRLNGHQAISFVINKKDNADVIRTVDAVKELSREENEFLPEGVEILYSNDFSRYVRNRFDVVQSNGLIGLTLVLFMLSIFLDFRSAFWVALGIPVTLFGALFLMPIFNVNLNSISMVAMIIVIGIIVDDGIIIAENIQRHREKGESPLESAVNGIQEVFAPVLTTALTTFMAFAPMFFMTGILGDFIFAIPLLIGLALFISMAEGIISLPAHLTMGIRFRNGTEKRPPRRSWFQSLIRPCRRFECWMLRWRYLIVFVFILLLAASLWFAATNMRFELFPSSMAEQFVVLVELPTGTSLQATSDKVSEIENIVADLPAEELQSFITRVGTQEVYPAGGYPPGENENWAFIWVSLSPFTERSRSAEEIVEDLRQRTGLLKGYDDIVFSIEAGGPPVGKPITIQIVGSDDTVRVKLADSLANYLSLLPGVHDIVRNDKLGKEQVEIKINYDKLSRLGLTVADVAQNVRIAYDGEVVTNVRYGDEDLNFRVLLEENARKKPRFLRELLIPNRQGRLIPLKDVASFRTGPGPSNYHHYDEKRSITVTADIVKGQTTSLEATRKVLEDFRLENDWPGMRFIVGGEAEETEKSMLSLYKAFALAAAGIYLLLILLFSSPTQPLIVMSAIPFGIVGVILTFALHSEPLGFVAMLGVIGLAGVLVNDSLVLVSHINRLRSQRPDEDLSVIVAEGTSDRLRPVILTSLTTIAGLLPLAYGIGGSDPYMAPMALALAYGLIFATPITLVLVPSFYMVTYDIQNLFRRGK